MNEIYDAQGLLFARSGVDAVRTVDGQQQQILNKSKYTYKHVFIDEVAALWVFVVASVTVVSSVTSEVKVGKLVVVAVWRRRMVSGVEELDVCVGE